MIPFLRQTAEYYYTQGVDNKCFIFPNRRAIAFFRKHLCEIVAEKSEQPLVMPEMLTINDFFYKVSGERETDRVIQMLVLYDCYKSCLPKGMTADSLDDFIFWGDVLLADFNDIDKYLVNARQLFANIVSFRDLDPSLEDLTPEQKRALEKLVSHFKNKDTSKDKTKQEFMRIWNILYPLYELFNKRLSENNQSYEGMVYRRLAESLKNGDAKSVLDKVLPHCNKFIFIGLNALNECEKTVLKKMRKESLAEFCWDFSSDMIKDPENQASKFMRNRDKTGNIDLFPQAFEPDPEGKTLPEFNIVSVPSSVGQTSQIPLIMRDLEAEKSAIVIPDETLLLPLLNSIPKEIKDINVTMGYPMKDSSFFALMTQVANLQIHLRKRSDGEYCFYHKQVYTIFSNELFRKSCTGQEIIDKIRSEAKYYIPASDFKGDDILEKIFSPVIKDVKSVSSGCIEEFATYLKDVAMAIALGIKGDADLAIELEFAKKYYQSINLLLKYKLEILPATFVRLLMQLLSGISVPFDGEPLKGLQIMGPLETRALDFENIVILSSNEGVFPRRSVSSSFIPPELRAGFGLPTYEYQDRVWAYYFYRMIQRASKVWLIYDSRQSGLQSGEESRYIKQLEFIYKERLGLKINRLVATAKAAKDEEKAIGKTAEDIVTIKSKKLSATVLERYLNCPAQFYYSFVSGLSQDEQVAESLDSAMIGDIFHEVMQCIYTGPEAMAEDFDIEDKEARKRITPLKDVTMSYLKSLNDKDIENKINAVIRKKMKSFDISGRDIITRNLIFQYVKNCIDRDIELLKTEKSGSFGILGLEIYKEWSFNGFNFKGYIDRLDRIGDKIRVVDYKTGKVLDKEKFIDSSNAEDVANTLFSTETSVHQRPKIAFQLFLYDMLVEKDFPGRQLFNSVYHITNLFSEPVTNVPVNEDFCNIVKERLEEVLDEIANPEISFRLTSDKDVCKYCDFKNICGR